MAGHTAAADPAPVRAYFENFARGDFGAVKAQFTAGAVVTVPGAGLLAGRYEGRDGFDRFLGVLGGHVDGPASDFRVDDIAVGQHYVIVREIARLLRQDTPGRAWELPLLLRFTVEDGLISRLDITPEDQAGYDTFWTA
ncbi:MAG: hypothetical protein JWM73_2391 [Solirubrobacterales bacterium]|nr:hypothetical protein [Solirubrobacterales bacterium]